ncbi:MAG: hypothetical protein HRU17_11770 [Polyangiaceae bacterium]|nr:hypothetical protein [Polyangiaceae bacterium]
MPNQKPELSAVRALERLESESPLVKLGLIERERSRSGDKHGRRIAQATPSPDERPRTPPQTPQRDQSAPVRNRPPTIGVLSRSGQIV